MTLTCLPLRSATESPNFRSSLFLILRSVGALLFNSVSKESSHAFLAALGSASEIRLTSPIVSKKITLKNAL
jgi:hypothetical protein